MDRLHIKREEVLHREGIKRYPKFHERYVKKEQVEDEVYKGKDTHDKDLRLKKNSGVRKLFKVKSEYEGFVNGEDNIKELIVKQEEDSPRKKPLDEEEDETKFPASVRDFRDIYQESSPDGKPQSKCGRLQTRLQRDAKYHPYLRDHHPNSYCYDRDQDYDSRSSTTTGEEHLSDDADQIFQSQVNQELSQQIINDTLHTPSLDISAQQTQANVSYFDREGAEIFSMEQSTECPQTSTLANDSIEQDGLSSEEKSFLQLMMNPYEAQIPTDEDLNLRMFPNASKTQQAYEELRELQAKCNRLTGAMNYARESMNKAKEKNKSEYAVHRKQLLQLCYELGTLYAKEDFARTCFQELLR